MKEKNFFLNTQTNSNCSFSLLTIKNLVEWAHKRGFFCLSIADYFPFSIMDFFSLCKEKKIKPVWGIKFFGRLKIYENAFYKLSITAFPKNYDGYKNINEILFSVNSSLNERVFLLEQVLPILSKNCFLVLELNDIEIARKFSIWWFALSFAGEVVYENIFLGFNFFISRSEKKSLENILDKLLPFFSFKFFENLDKDALIYLKKTRLVKNFFPEDYQGPFFSCSITKEDFFKYCTDDEEIFSVFLEKLDYFISSINLDLTVLLEKKNSECILKQQKESFFLLEKKCQDKLNSFVINLSEEEKMKYSSILEEELKVIRELGYCNYLLILSDIVAHLKDNKIIIGFGRGSAVSSLVVFLLEITKIDPIKYSLFFERFLNKNRKCPADIDLDVEESGIVFDYLLKRYSKKLRVARILIKKRISFVDALTEMINLFSLNRKEFELIFDSGWDLLSENIKPWKLKFPVLFFLVERILGLNYEFHLHPSGVIINEDPLDYIPLTSFQNYPVALWSESILNELGFKKYDFLSVGALGFLRFVEDTFFIQLPSCSEIDLKDEKTWNFFNNFLLTGIFHLDTPLARKLFVKVAPNSFSELTLFLALNKPGNINKINKVIEQKRRCYVPNVSNCILEITSDTNHCIVFEEQVSQVLSLAYNCSFSEAEVKRREFIISFPKINVFLDETKKLNTRLSNSDLEWIYEQLPSPGSVLFNKSHAVAYSMLIYYCVFLKANYFDKLIVFWLNNDKKDNASEYLREAFFLGYEIIPLGINHSSLYWTLRDNNSLVMGFSSLKGYKEAFFIELIEERKKRGRFFNLKDLLERTFIWWKGIDDNTLDVWFKSGLFKGLFARKEQQKKDDSKALFFLQLQKLFSFPLLE